MNTLTAKKIVQVRTHHAFAFNGERLIQDSVAQLKNSMGCLYCRLDAEERRLGYWLIHCAWDSIDTMQVGVEGIFRPVVETLIASNALLSLHVCEASSGAE